MGELGMLIPVLVACIGLTRFTGQERKKLFSPKWVLNTSGIRVVLLPGDEAAATAMRPLKLIPPPAPKVAQFR